MSVNIILEKNPLSTNVVRNFFTDKMFESIKKDNVVPEDFKNFVLNEKISNENLCLFIEANPRGLFDLFDEHNIIIEIFLYPDNSFCCKIGNQSTTNSWKTRKEAEFFAIEAAFKILEEKLNIKNNEK